MHDTLIKVSSVDEMLLKCFRAYKDIHHIYPFCSYYGAWEILTQKGKSSKTPCQCFFDINDFEYTVGDYTASFKMTDAISRERVWLYNVIFS